MLRPRIPLSILLGYGEKDVSTCWILLEIWGLDCSRAVRVPDSGFLGGQNGFGAYCVGDGVWGSRGVGGVLVETRALNPKP